MGPGLADLVSRADIEQLVDEFYTRVRADAVLGPIFDDVAHIDWDRHLPRMYDFWDTVLLGAARFSGSPMTVHRELAGQVPLGAAEFERWLGLFRASVDACFRGPGADDAKLRALRIAAVMQHQIAAAAGRPPAARP